MLNIHWKDWCWSWNSNTLATWCEELTHWKRPWCWERLKAGGEGDDRGWDIWMASPTRWTQVWANSRRWWRTGKPGVLQSTGSQRVEHNWATELTERNWGNTWVNIQVHCNWTEGHNSTRWRRSENKVWTMGKRRTRLSTREQISLGRLAFYKLYWSKKYSDEKWQFHFPESGGRENSEERVLFLRIIVNLK